MAKRFQLSLSLTTLPIDLKSESCLQYQGSKNSASCQSPRKPCPICELKLHLAGLTPEGIDLTEVYAFYVGILESVFGICGVYNGRLVA